MIKVLAGFPGVGKSYFVDNLAGKYKLEVSDSDSSDFSWIENGKGNKVRNPNFVEDYVSHIKEMMETNDLVCVSTHAEILEELYDEGIEFIVVVPLKGLKNEYIQRYIERGSPDGFVNIMKENYESFVDQLIQRSDQGKCELFVLSKGETFETAVKEVVMRDDLGDLEEFVGL